MNRIKFEKMSPLYVAISELPCCGCGDPGSVYQAIHALLSYFDLRNKPEVPKSTDFDNIDVYESPFMLFMVYYLAHEGYLDHGTSIGSAWLTEKGDDMLGYLKVMAPYGYDLDEVPHDILYTDRGDKE